jgi:UDP-glucose 4-epimerase
MVVTGGAGFIGSCFVLQWLAEKKYPVVVLGKPACTRRDAPHS